MKPTILLVPILKQLLQYCFFIVVAPVQLYFAIVIEIRISYRDVIL